MQLLKEKRLSTWIRNGKIAEMDFQVRKTRGRTVCRD